MLMNAVYYQEMSKLEEFQEDNNRGHGIMIININSFLVAIPLRSSLKPHLTKARYLFPYGTYINNDNKTLLKALDFSKIILVEEYHIDTTKNYIFKDKAEEQFYIDNFNRIKLRVNNYIEGYVTMCKKLKEGKEVNKYLIKNYRFTTLKNFHEQLGILLTKEEYDEKLNNFFGED